MSEVYTSTEITDALEIAIRSLTGGNEAMDAALAQVVANRDIAK